ncbi:hypothetical protein [Saccharothrix sp. Mg75]|uniref:hypothetical protein n=1 Tax=Saccharothrix sp. Mg75 TaxID=3445357 RepID=UPI003EEEE04B
MPAVALVAALGVALVACQPQEGARGVVTSAVDTYPVVGAAGYREFRLGMTEQEVRATGAAEPEPDGTKCAFYRMTAADGGMWVEEGKGVVAIRVESGARTNEQIRVDVHPDDPVLARAYPAGEHVPGRFRVALGDGVSLLFDGGVTVLRPDQTCF